jgi:hypothetical protein
MMKRLAICAVGLALAGWSASSLAADADVVLQNDSPYPMFVSGTDNNASPPITSMRVRLDPTVGTTVGATLDDHGNYNVTWTATDAVDPPTKSQSGHCSGARDAICNVDLSAATPLPAPSAAAAPAALPPPSAPATP